MSEKKNIKITAAKCRPMLTFDDWRAVVDCVMADTAYDGKVLVTQDL